MIGRGGEKSPYHGMEYLAHLAGRGCERDLQRYLADMHHADFSYQRPVRTKDIVSQGCPQRGCQCPGGFACHPVLTVLEIDVYQSAVRGIVEVMAFFFLLVIHLTVIVLHYLLDDRIVGVPGLQDDISAAVFPAGASCHLRHHLERTFKSPEIGTCKHGVGIKDANDVNIVEVEALGYHLGSDKDVGLVLGKVGEYALVGIALTGSVKVETCCAAGGEMPANLLLYLLCAETKGAYICLLTTRALTGHIIGGAAIMAYQPVELLMIGQADITELAFGHPSALAAFHDGRIAAPVLEQDDLFLVAQGFFHLLYQTGRERQGHHFAPQEVLDINHLYDGHLDIAVPLTENDMTILSADGIMVGLYAGRGRAEKNVGMVL